ncbi:MAG: DUF72 domain-containing protein, partial [Myxococcaceae bacterium]
VLFQLPPWVKVDLPRLNSFLETLPGGVRASFEFRHPTWFSNEVLDCLRDHGAALCVSESELLQTPLAPTASWGYLRLRRTDYDEEELRGWAHRIAMQPWTDAYVFLKHDEDGLGPWRAARLQSLLAEEVARLGGGIELPH